MNPRALTPAQPDLDQDNPAVSSGIAAADRPTSTRRLVARVLSYLLRLVVVACLAIDAYVHLDLAHNYDPIRASVSQGTLFRYEAAAAIVAGALLLITGRTFAWIIAFVVLAAGFAAVMTYQYVDIGAFGPFPEMYDPYWTSEKALSVVAEGVGAALAGAMVLVRLRTWWRTKSS
jgi:hypothetical protein